MVNERYRGLYDILNAAQRERYQKLGDRFERHMGPIRDELQEKEDELRAKLEELEVDLPDVPEGEETRRSGGPEPLFESGRDWYEQTMEFRRYAGLEKEGEE